MPDPSLTAARLVVAAGRGLWRALPGPLRKGLEDRAFYAVFQMTRVENDAYGWRPGRDAPPAAAPAAPPPGGPPAGPPRPHPAPEAGATRPARAP